MPLLDKIRETQVSEDAGGMRSSVPIASEKAVRKRKSGDEKELKQN